MLAILFIGIYFFLNELLKKNGISYQSISISYPLNLKIKDFVLDKPTVKLEIKNADIDLHLGSLLSGEFKGENLIVSGAVVSIKPSSSPFSYSVIPVIDYNKVRLKQVLIKIESISDTISLDFPELNVDQLFWNDSITINSLRYKKGRFVFAYSKTNNLDTVEEKPEPFHIPDGVPKFKVKQLEIVEHNIQIRKADSKTQLANINLELQGWNNYGGADLTLKRLDFLIQDTLSVKITSKELSVQNYKGAVVHALSLKIPGLELNMNELTIHESKDGKEIRLKLNRSYFSPQLIRLLDKNNSLFKSNASVVYFKGELIYSQDTLRIKKLALNTKGKSNLTVTGNVYELNKQPVFDLMVSPFILISNELEELITLEIPSTLLNSELKCQMRLKGTPDDYFVNGTYDYNTNSFGLNAHIHQLKNKRLLADIQLQASVIDLKKLSSESEKDLVIHKLVANSTIDLGKLSQLNKLDVHLQSDSILYNNKSIIHPDLNVSFQNNTIEFWLESVAQNWKISATAYGDLFKSQEIRFTGYAFMEDLGKINKDYPTGILSTNFNGQVNRSADSLYVLFKLDKLLLTSKTGNKNQFNSSEIKFLKKRSQYSVDIHSGSDKLLQAEFSDELVNWIKNPKKEKSSLPDFYLHSTLKLDSNLTQQFIGTKIHVDLKQLELRSEYTNITGLIDIPMISYGSSKVTNLKSTLTYGEKEKKAELQVEQIITNFLNLDSIQSSVKLFNTDSLKYQLNAKIPTISEYLKLSGGFNLLSEYYHICFSKQNSFQLGAQNWQYIEGDGIFINRKTKKISGNLQIANQEQKFIFSESNDVVNLELDSIKMGPIADIFVKDFEVDARLYVRSTFDQHKDELGISGILSEIELDSIALGNTSFSTNLTPSKQNFSCQLVSSAWNMHFKAQKTSDKSEIEATIDQLNLSKLDSIFHLVSSEFELSGDLKGEVKIVNEKTNTSEGQLQFDKFHFKMKEYGTEANIDHQQIKFSDHSIRLNDFTITDVAKNEIKLNGKIGLSDKDQSLLSIASKKFIVFTNDKNNAITKGKLEIESDLKIDGDINDLAISGDLNLLKGGNINHYHKSNASLNGTNEDVVFINFSEEKEKKFVRKPIKRQIPIRWNVNMNLGSTEVYVLLDKTKQNYVKLYANGDLQLRKGKEILPEVFGSVISTQGKIYYDLPIVSDVEMTIIQAKSQWNGDLKNPILNFKGVETFRVTPNEMSAELSDKKNRVPVDVTALVNNKTLKNFELNFDISSGNADVQNMLSALPSDTKESYAISMLVHGKVNSESKNGNSTMEPIVNKLNEIARRNFKNSDLSFHTDNTSNQNADGTKSAEKIGYNFSKEFYDNKLKVMVGGNFDVGATTNETKSAPLGTIELDYLLKEEPNITLKLKRENAYRGPIEGQVDESSVSINFNKRYNNLFLLKPRANKDSTAIKNK